MTTRNFIFYSILIIPFMGCGERPNGDLRKVTVQEVRFEEVEDDVDPPPPQLISNFTSVKDWLVNVCDTDKPPKLILTYQVGLFESENDFTLFLVGTNRYDEGQYRSVTHIEFQPTNMYFKLPQRDYQNLDREKVVSQLTSQLKDFSNTEKFKNSFLAQANKFVFTTNGEVIWSKE